MNRRAFLMTAGACLLPTMSLAKEDEGKRLFDKFSYAEDRWEPIDPHDIRERDVIWIRDVPPSDDLPGNGIVVDVKANDEEGIWSHYRVDPETNEWV